MNATTPATTEPTVTITPLKSGGRSDMVVSDGNETPASFSSTAIVDQLRAFFDKIEAEADARKDDPVAMVNALARMEALLADVRYVTGVIRDHTATSLSDAKFRRVTVEGVATMEASSASERTDWQDRDLLLAMLDRSTTVPNVDYNTGEIIDHGAIADELLSWFRVQWRLTPIRDAGLNPDDYSHQPTNEDGTPLRTPTVTVKDNVLRRQQIA
jgi:hypothetical protein